MTLFAPSRLLLTGMLLASSAGIALAAPQATTPPAPASDPMATPAPPDTGAPASTATASNPSVGGAPMSTSKTIVDNASAASNLTTLVSAVKAAGLDATLAQPGPYTVFAPTNAAFSRLAPGTVDTLLKPANKATLTKVLTYHVVPGTITIDDLKAKAAAGGGKVLLTTVEGEPLTVAVDGQMITLIDVHGNKSYVETGDVRQSNGIVHVVNGVVLPKLG
ncbi:fasciclin domain-containing protein [Sphingomonas sp. GlSt437]|uniref:fasciclin domain-containing protein n=1 Tax=Sphingomonas sp. GlSt437 TaxID=3389970 RepID=UPI003A88E351